MSIPGKAGQAPGKTLGFMFASGSVGVFFSGLLTDQVDVARVPQGNVLFSLAAPLVAAAAYRQAGIRFVA